MFIRRLAWLFAALPLFASFTSASLSAAPVASGASDGRPNIVFILADDYGLDGVGCYGSDRFKGKTPNLDRLASEGIRFTHAYSEPLCGPTRVTIHTGRYVFRSGGTTNQNAGRPSSTKEPALARSLRQAGYVTGMAGKWRQVGETPGAWGYEEWITDPTAGGWYWKNSYTKNGEPIETKQEIYFPDVCMDFTRDFFQRHRDRPFFFYFPTHLIHGPILRTPDSKPGTKDYYEDNVAYLDKQVGSIVAALEKLGLRQKTLLLFAGDNGTARFGSDQSYLNGRKINGQKGTMLEGGSRVPFIASWAGTTPAGRVNHDLIDFTDLFPTFVELAGGRMPAGLKMDGRSFVPQLRGAAGSSRDWIFVQLGARWFVRERGFKLTEGGELFDMSDAPFVEKPVPAAGAPAAAQAARVRLQAVLDELKPNEGSIAGEGDRAKKKRKKGKA